MTASPPNPPTSGIAGLIGQIAVYVDRPWKAAVVLLAFVFGGVGWVLYEQREEFIEAWLTPSTTELRTAEVPAALDKLVTETDADIVQIWAVDMSSNSQWFLGARGKGGERPVVPAPRRLPIIVQASDVRALIDVLEGNPTCITLSSAGSPLVRRMAERGMRRGCGVPIPPDPTNFVGIIYLAWAVAVDPSTENVAIGAAREIAGKLVTR